MIQPIESPLLATLRPVKHGFFSRRGGVSGGLYESLNCGLGSGDAARNVIENRRLAMAALKLGPDSLATVRQVHGCHVVTLDGKPGGEAPPQADALVTRCPGVALGILTADCVPVLLADATAGVIGAAHAGWRGALAGVVAACVGAMGALGARPADIHAAIGPAIAGRNYEVGADVFNTFTIADNGNRQFFSPAGQPAHYLFDLGAYVAAALGRAGVGASRRLSHDTYGEEDLFFSYRRSCHRGEADFGRCLSAIVITELS